MNAFATAWHLRMNAIQMLIPFAKLDSVPKESLLFELCTSTPSVAANNVTSQRINCDSVNLTNHRINNINNQQLIEDNNLGLGSRPIYSVEAIGACWKNRPRSEWANGRLGVCVCASVCIKVCVHSSLVCSASVRMNDCLRTEKWLSELAKAKGE